MQSLKNTLQILGCVALGILISFLSHWENEIIQTIYSTLILIFLLIGFLKVLKSPNKENESNNQIRNKDNNINLIDLVVNQQKPFKAIELSQNPTQGGEELGEIFLETMKGGKKKMEKIKDFFKRVWGNKFTILSIVFSLFCVFACEYLYFADYFLRFDWVENNQVVLNYVLPIVGIAYIVLNVFTTITKYGWENLKELQEKAYKKALEKASQLTKEQKAIVKNQMKEVKEQLSNVGIDLTKTNTIIEAYETLRDLGIALSDEKVSAYNLAVAKKPELDLAYTQLTSQLETLLSKLK